MKTIILVSVVAALIATVFHLGASLIGSQGFAANECLANHSACFRPALSFASLH